MRWRLERKLAKIEGTQEFEEITSENWAEIRSKIAPSNSADYADRTCHAIASSMRTRHSRFSLPRVRVVHATASPELFQSASLRFALLRAVA